MRKLLAVLAAISMVLAATTYTFWRNLETERARADVLQARIAALESRHPATPVSQATHSSNPAPAEPQTPVTPAASDTSSAKADDDDDYKEYMERRRQLLRDPKYYEAARASLRPNHASRRAELIRVLGISPAKADEIIDYWIDRQLRSEARVLVVPTTEQEALEQQELATRERSEDEERLRAIVGDALFPRMQDYIASRPSRNKTYELRTRLAERNEMLREDQVEPLIGLWHAEQARHQQEVQDFVATLGPDNASTETLRRAQQQINGLIKASNRRIHDSATAILSPQQLAELDAMLRAEVEAAQAQSNLYMMEASAGAK